MGNVLMILVPMARAVMKLAGMKEQNVETEPGTTIKFWTPNQTTNANANANKPPVVLLHGFFGDGIFTWFLQMLALALTRKYAVYVPDLLFFGGSTTDYPNRSTSFQAECIAKGLEKLGVVEKCCVVGFSYGGMVAFKMAKMYPDLVGSVIVTGTVVEMTESLSNGLLENIVGCSSWSEFLIPTTVEGVRLLFAVGSYRPIFGRLPHFVYRDFLEVMFEKRKERAELLEALTVPDVEFIPPINYSQKIHLLWGNSDSIFNLECIREQLGENGTWHKIEKAGHIALLDRPNLYNHHLKTILASIHN